MVLIQSIKHFYLNNLIELINKEYIDLTRYELPAIEIVEYHDTGASYYPQENKIVLQDEEDEEQMIDYLLHELGHWVHDKVFQYKRFRWNQNEFEKRLDVYEGFAVVFSDWICDIESENTNKMRKLINEIR